MKLAWNSFRSPAPGLYPGPLTAWWMEVAFGVGAWDGRE